MASSPPASGHAIAWISSTMITVSTTPAMMVPLKEFSSASIRGFLPSNVVTPTALRPYVAVYALIGPDQTRDLGEELCAERNSGGLTPLEIRHAAVRHGLDAFAEILGAAQPVLLDQHALGGGADCAISRASAWAALRTSACGTSRSARPMRTASPPGMRRPV